MLLASRFSVPQFHRAPALNKPGRRQSLRQPIHPRPSLEHLEERTLLDASGMFGGANNLTINGAAATSGNILPVPSSGEHSASISGLDASGRSADTASDALAAQDQPNAQFRLFGINSEGESSRSVQRNTANILRDAYGFGSGTMPNAPWMLNAYNLGLANHQFNYSSQSDMGFSAVPPWYHAAQSLPKDQTPSLDKDQKPSLNTDEQGTDTPEQLATEKSTPEQEQSQQPRLDKDVGAKGDDLKDLLEERASEKNSPLEAATEEDGTLPDSLWLSALAPAPMAALVAGLPGMSAAAEGGEAGAEGGDGVEAAPE